jgi:hypothetical protein
MAGMPGRVGTHQLGELSFLPRAAGLAVQITAAGDERHSRCCGDCGNPVTGQRRFSYSSKFQRMIELERGRQEATGDQSYLT